MTQAAVAPPVPATESEILVSVRDVKKHFPIKGGVLGFQTVGAVRAVDGRLAPEAKIPLYKRLGRIWGEKLSRERNSLEC